MVDLNHNDAIQAICDATSVTIFSYQEAIEGYFKLRGLPIPGDAYVGKVSDEENPLISIAMAIAFAPHDWGSHHRLAWIYGIASGWDEAALSELTRTHKWTPETVARLRRLHDRYVSLQRQTAQSSEKAS